MGLLNKYYSWENDISCERDSKSPPSFSSQKCKHHFPHLFTFLPFNTSQYIFQKVLVLPCVFCIKQEPWLWTDVTTDKNWTVRTTVNTALGQQGTGAHAQWKVLLSLFIQKEFQNQG